MLHGIGGEGESPEQHPKGRAEEKKAMQVHMTTWPRAGSSKQVILSPAAAVVIEACHAPRTQYCSSTGQAVHRESRHQERSTGGAGPRPEAAKSPTLKSAGEH